MKTENILGRTDDTGQESPLDELFSTLIPVLVSEADTFHMPPDDYPRLPEPKVHYFLVSVLNHFYRIA